MNKAVFYQKFEDKLQLFDNRINLLLTGIFKEGGRDAIPEAPKIAPIVPVINTQPSSGSGFTSGDYFILLLYSRGAGRRRVQITESTITLNLCSSLSFDYKILDSSHIELTSTSQYDPNCPRTNEKLFLDTVLSSKKYKVDSDGAITLTSGEGKDIISLNMR